MGIIKFILLITMMAGIEAKTFDCLPCGCNLKYTGIVQLYCGSSLTGNDLKDAFKKLKNYDNYQFRMTLQEDNITEVNSEYFTGFPIKILEIVSVITNGYSVDMLMNQVNSLEDVTFYTTFLSELPFKQVQKLKILQTFSVSRNPKITHVPEWNQTNPEKMKRLDLGENGIITIDKNAFKQFINLFSLRLVQNKLTCIDQITLPIKLQLLDLNQNGLSKLPGEELNSMTKSSKVLLQFNKIYTFSDVDIDYLLNKTYTLEFSYYDELNCTGCQFKRIAQQNMIGWNSRLYARCYYPKQMEITKLTTSMYSNCPDLKLF